MKFSTTAIFTSLVSLSAAASLTAGKTFGLITINSGSTIQNAGATVSNDVLKVGTSSKDWFEGKANENGVIAVGDKFLNINSQGALSLADQGIPFSVSDEGLLKIGESTAFTAKKVPDGYDLSVFPNPSSDNIDLGVGLKVFYA